MDLFSLYATIGLKDDGFQSGINKAKENTGGLTSGVKNLVSTVAGIKLVSTAFNMIASSVSSAVSRYDTLNAFPKVMEQMGYGADNAETAISNLSDGISGLPTTLDSITATTKGLTLTLGNLDKGTNLALALNDAFYASGASADEASRGLTQYQQMLAAGTVDAQAWKTINETMKYALMEVSEAMLGTGATTNQLYDAIKSGSITMDEVNNKFIELDAGVGGFAEVARAATGGIGTAWTNMQSAITRGVTGIITSIDTNLTNASLPNLEESIGLVADGFTSFLNIGSNVAGGFIKTVTPAIKLISKNMDILAPTIIASTTAFGAYKAITSFTNATKIASKAVEAATYAQNILKSSIASGNIIQELSTALKSKDAVTEGIRMAAKQAGLVVDKEGAIVTAAGTLATEAEASAILASAGTLSAKTALLGAHSIASGISTVATNLFGAALNALPLIGVIAGIGALVGAISGIVKWTNRNSEAMKKQKDVIADLDENYSSLQAEVESTETELQGVNDRIDEILAQGTITVVDQAELKTLNATKSELEGILITQKELASIEHKKLADETVKALGLVVKSYGAVADERWRAEDVTLTERTKINIDYYNQLAKEVEGLSSNYEENAYSIERITEIMEDLRGQIVEDTSTLQGYNATLKDGGDAYKDYYNETNEAINAAIDFIAPLQKATEVEAEAADTTGKLSKAYINWSENTAKLTNSQLELEESISGTLEAWGDTKKTLKLQSDTVNSLVTDIMELAEKERLSAYESKQLALKTKQLNEYTGDLGLEFNAMTGSLNMSTEELLKNTKAWSGQKANNDIVSTLNGLLEEQIQIEQNLEDIQSQKIDLAEMYNSNKISLEAYDESLAVLISTEETASEQLESNKEATIEANRLMAESVKDSIDSQILSYDDLSESLKGSIDLIISSMTSYQDITSDMFNVIDTKMEISLSKAASNLDKNTNAMGEWADNIALLADQGINQGLLETLMDGTEESIALTKSLADATADQRNEFVTAWETNANAGTDAYKESLRAAGVPEDVIALMDEAANAAETSVLDTDWSGIGQGAGEAVGDGIGLGFKSSIFKIQSATGDLAFNGIEDPLRTALGWHSPSTLAIEAGEDFILGLEQGLETGISTLPSAMQTVVNSLMESFEQAGTKGGQSLATGINTGLNIIPSIVGIALAPVTKTITSWTLQAYQALNNGLKLSNSAVVLEFSKMNTTATTGITSYKTTIINGANSIMAPFKAALTLMETVVTTWGANLSVKGTNSVNQLKNSIESTANTISLYSAGQNIVDGMWDGMKSKQSAFYSNIYNYFKGIVTQAKSALEIASPSKIMATLGGFTVEGFIIGLENMSTKLDNVMDNIFTPNLSDLQLSTNVTGNGQLAYTGVGATIASGQTVNNYFTQNLQSVAQTPHENAVYAQTLFDKARWA